MDRNQGQAQVEEMMKKLSADDQKKVESILQNKTALENLLSSPQAQLLLKQFGGK